MYVFGLPGCQINLLSIIKLYVLCSLSIIVIRRKKIKTSNLSLHTAKKKKTKNKIKTKRLMPYQNNKISYN